MFLIRMRRAQWEEERERERELPPSPLLFFLKACASISGLKGGEGGGRREKISHHHHHELLERELT